MKRSLQYINRTDIPLVMRMSIERLVVLLEKSPEIFSTAGITVDGKVLSVQKLVNVRETTAILESYRQSYSTYNLYHVISKPAYVNEHVAYENHEAYSIDNTMSDIYKLLEKLDINVYVFSNGFDKYVPGIIVGDDQGSPYFLYSDLATSLSTPIMNSFNKLAAPASYKVLPLNLNIAESVIKGLKNDVLYTALAKFDNSTARTRYRLYDLSPEDENGYKFKEYFRKILPKFGFNDKSIDLMYNYLSVPLINLAPDTNGDMNIASALVCTNMNKLKLSNSLTDDDMLVVLTSLPNGRVLMLNTIKEINSVNGTLYNTAEETMDMVEAGESYKMVTEKLCKGENDYNAEVLDGMRVYNSSEEPDDNIIDGYRVLKAKGESALTNKEKLAGQYKLAEFFANKYIDEGQGVSMKGLSESALVLNSLMKDTKDIPRDTLKKYLLDKIYNKSKEYYNKKEYERLVYLTNIQDMVSNRFEEV